MSKRGVTLCLFLALLGREARGEEEARGKTHYKLVRGDLSSLYRAEVKYRVGDVVSEPTGHGLYFYSAGLGKAEALMAGLELATNLERGLFRRAITARDFSFRLIEVEPVGETKPMEHAKLKAPALRVIRVVPPEEAADALLSSENPHAQELGTMMLAGSPTLMKKLGHKVNLRSAPVSTAVRWGFYRDLSALKGVEVKGVHHRLLPELKALRGTIEGVDERTGQAAVRTRDGKLERVHLHWIKPVRRLGAIPPARR